jgi:glycosyltransferase involved in cell wall biosynthesis
LHHNSAFDSGTFTRDGILCLVAWALRTPIFLKIHGSHLSSFGKLRSLQGLMRYLILSLSTGIGVLSSQERAEFISKWPRIARKVFVVKNIVRPDFLNAEVLSQDRPMVFFASRFIREKGIFDLLEAIPGILKILPNCRFTFVGDGPDMKAFLNRVEELGLTQEIEYKSNRSYSELIEMYVSGVIFVFPTHFPEGMPMAMIEAMAVGLLVISSPVRFVRDIPFFALNDLLLSEQQNNYSAEISDLVLQSIGNVQLRSKIGGLNKEFAAGYSQEEVAGEYISLYHTLLNF